MKTHLIHKNLNTSFVNLSALVRHLRQQNFIGVVHLEMKDYEADVFLKKKNKIEAREKDRLAGRVSVGDGVLERLLIRGREPGGIVHVYQSIEEDKTPLKNPIPKPFDKPPITVKNTPPNPDNNWPIKETVAPELEISPHPQSVSIPPAAEDSTTPKLEMNPPVKDPQPTRKKKPVSLKANPIMMGKSSAKPLETPMLELDPPSEKPALKSAFASLKEKLGLPFSFINQKKAKTSEEDWQELLELTGELLATVEKSMAHSNLNFSWAFDKARTEIFSDYPFLDPQLKIFEYADGRVLMSEQVSTDLFVKSIAESLQNILEKLEAYPKFAEVHGLAIEDISNLMNKRRRQYDKFSLTPAIKQLIEC